MAHPDDRWQPGVHGLALAGLRDISIHPDGRQVVFNAGFKKNEQWVMENLPLK